MVIVAGAGPGVPNSLKQLRKLARLDTPEPTPLALGWVAPIRPWLIDLGNPAILPVFDQLIDHAGIGQR